MQNRLKPVFWPRAVLVQARSHCLFNFAVIQTLQENGPRHEGGFSPDFPFTPCSITRKIISEPVLVCKPHTYWLVPRQSCMKYFVSSYDLLPGMCESNDSMCEFRYELVIYDNQRTGSEWNLIQPRMGLKHWASKEFDWRIDGIFGEDILRSLTLRTSW